MVAAAAATALTWVMTTTLHRLWQITVTKNVLDTATNEMDCRRKEAIIKIVNSQTQEILLQPNKLGLTGSKNMENI